MEISASKLNNRKNYFTSVRGDPEINRARRWIEARTIFRRGRTSSEEGMVWRAFRGWFTVALPNTCARAVNQIIATCDNIAGSLSERLSNCAPEMLAMHRTRCMTNRKTAMLQQPTGMGCYYAATAVRDGFLLCCNSR